MGKVQPGVSVGALVAERMGRSRVFERLGIDYCCHGEATLAEACADRSLDVASVVAELEADDARREMTGPDVQDEDRAWSPGRLIDHIVTTHHAYLARELPRLSMLIDRVTEAHGARHPELGELRRVFRSLHRELVDHMMKEECILFPLVKCLEEADRPIQVFCGTLANPIRIMEHEHESAGEALGRIKTLTDGYRVPADGCSSFKALLEGLQVLEFDLHRHIHKENNVLFPMAADLEARLAARRA
ncbi:MAG: iron-sulfur cluster repair di-iron protein [Isosphaeraceae bacterium]